MSAHTPGPWRIARDNFIGGGGSAPVVVGGDADIARVLRADVGEVVADRNARLISAAPELLAALEAVLPYAEKSEDAGADPSKAVAAARAAIAKARVGA